MASKKEPHVFHVAVVGMSGPSCVRGDFGVGKSCLCNRFVRPDEDDFHTDHASTISQSDFGGRVINNDQFLYWGEVTKDYSGVDIMYRVIEHTELVDDASFLVFRGSFSGKYSKRCAETKLQSPEKVAYVCGDQLGDEKSFPRQVIPKGKFQINGFLLVFDVSNVRGRPITTQIDFIENLYSAIARTNKPIVLVASKCDAVCDTHLNELKEFARHKKLVLTECSANLGVNVETPFLELASRVTKKLPHTKPLTYQEALSMRCELLSTLSARYDELLKATVAVTWKMMKGKLRDHADYREYVKLAGTLAAKKKFNRQMMRMKPQYENYDLTPQKSYFMPEPTKVDETLHKERIEASHCDHASSDDDSCYATVSPERSPAGFRQSTLRQEPSVTPSHCDHASRDDDSCYATVSPEGSLAGFRQSTLRQEPPVRPRKPFQQTEESSENYYEVTAMRPAPSTRYMKDISRMHTMKATGLCLRWMGTMNLQDGSKKCVVLTAMKVKNDLHWDQCVMRSLDLPSTDHVAEVMGIGFIGGELHLVQEHFECKTLESRLIKACHTEEQIPVSEIVSHITGILEGMEILHAYGFLHPGLSTRKILLTMRGVCKLYDFCLAEDAAKMTSLRKTKMQFSLNHFAPEVLRSGEYTEYSDVWSTGVVIYEILTGDKQLFSAEYVLDSVATTSVPQNTTKYPELRNETLWKCWTDAPSLRPTMNQLRTTYKEVFDSPDSDRDDYLVPDVDPYYSPVADDENHNTFGTIYGS